MSHQSDSAERPEPVYSIKEWCVLRRISEPYFFKLQKAGKGPRVIHVGRRTLVTGSADQSWLKGLEARDSA
jgi:hypothetical protein